MAAGARHRARALRTACAPRVAGGAAASAAGSRAARRWRLTRARRSRAQGAEGLPMPFPPFSPPYYVRCTLRCARTHHRSASRHDTRRSPRAARCCCAVPGPLHGRGRGLQRRVSGRKRWPCWRGSVCATSVAAFDAVDAGRAVAEPDEHDEPHLAGGRHANAAAVCHAGRRRVVRPGGGCGGAGAVSAAAHAHVAAGLHAGRALRHGAADVRRL